MKLMDGVPLAMLFHTVATDNVFTFKLIKIKGNIKIQLLSCMSHISSAQETHVARGYQTGQCRHVVLPSCRKLCWTALLSKVRMTSNANC